MKVLVTKIIFTDTCFDEKFRVMVFLDQPDVELELRDVIDVNGYARYDRAMDMEAVSEISYIEEREENKWLPQLPLLRKPPRRKKRNG